MDKFIPGVSGYVNKVGRLSHITLHANILIVENLTNLSALSAEGFMFHAAPVKVKGAAAFPVRAYAVG